MQIYTYIIFLLIIISSNGVKILLICDSFQASLPNEFNTTSKNIDKVYKTQVIFYNGNNSTISEEIYKSACREISGGVTVIIDTTSYGWLRIKKTADKLGIPYLRVEISIAPIAMAAASYALHLNVSDAALIFQNKPEMQQALNALMGNTRLRITVHNRLDRNVTKLLKNTRPWPEIFMLFANTYNMGPLIKSAVGGGLIKQDQQWLLVLLNFPSVIQDWSENLPKAVVEFRPSVLEMCCPLLGLSAGCICPEDTGIIRNFVKIFMKFLHEILITGGKKINEEIKYDCILENKNDEASLHRIETFNNLMAQILPKYSVLLYDTERKVITYRAAMDISVIRANNAGRTYLASWSIDRGIVVTSGRQVTAPKQFQRVGMLHMEPWSKYNQQWSGYCVDFLIKLSQLMDFEYEIMKPDSNGFGERQEDGTWTSGLISQLQKREIDLIVAPMTMTSDREEVIDFIVPYYDQTGISIVIRQPEQSTSLFKFMTVLNTEVWLSVLGALVITGIMIWLLDYFSPYSYRNDPARYPYPCRKFTIKESFWFALTSFTPQGGGEVPKSISARALVAAYWLFVVLMLATFTANLAAFLTVERLQVPVQSLEQLARQSRVTYGVVNNSTIHQYFKNMRNAEITMYKSWVQATMGKYDDEAKYRVWNYPVREQYNIILDNAIKLDSPEEGIKKVLSSEDGSFAFIHDALWLRYEISKSCVLTEIGEMFAEQPYAIAVYPGHPLSQEFSRRILQLQRDRFFEELVAKYWNQSFRASCPFVNDGEGISLSSIGGVFIATLFGLFLAIITLAAELLYQQHIIKKRGKNNNNIKKILGVKQMHNKKNNNGKIIATGNVSLIPVLPYKQ